MIVLISLECLLQLKECQDSVRIVLQVVLARVLFQLLEFNLDISFALLNRAKGFKIVGGHLMLG